MLVSLFLNFECCLLNLLHTTLHLPTMRSLLLIADYTQSLVVDHVICQLGSIQRCFVLLQSARDLVIQLMFAGEESTLPLKRIWITSQIGSNLIMY